MALLFCLPGMAGKQKSPANRLGGAVNFQFKNIFYLSKII